MPLLGRDVRGCGAGAIYHKPMRRRGREILADLEVQKARENTQPMLARPTYAAAAKVALQDGYRNDLREVSLCSNALVRRDTRPGHEVGISEVMETAGRRRFDGVGETSSDVQSVLFQPYHGAKVEADAETRGQLAQMGALRAHCTPFALEQSAYKV